MNVALIASDVCEHSSYVFPRKTLLTGSKASFWPVFGWSRPAAANWWSVGSLWPTELFNVTACVFLLLFQKLILLVSLYTWGDFTLIKNIYMYLLLLESCKVWQHRIPTLAGRQKRDLCLNITAIPESSVIPTWLFPHSHFSPHSYPYF